MPTPRSRVLALALLFTTIAALLVIADRAPLRWARQTQIDRIEKRFDHFYTGTVAGTIQGPYVYRLLVPRAVSAFTTILPSVRPIDADMYLKLSFLVALQALFFAYLRRFYVFIEALLGVFLLDSLTGYALAHIVGPNIIETGDILATCLFVVCLQALHSERYLLLSTVAVLSMFNRESGLLLLPAVIVHEWATHRTLHRSALILTALAAAYFGLRLVIGKGQWAFLDLFSNLPNPVANIYVFLLLGPLIALGCQRFSQHPAFLRHTACVVPPFIAVHYLVGRVVESRLWLPLFPIVIPLALGTLKRLGAEHGQNTSAA